MSNFLYVDGVAIDALVEGFDGPSRSSVEAFGRTMGDSLEGVVYSEKVEFSFKTPPLTPEEARSFTGLIQARKHYWSFNRPQTATTRFTNYSDDGGLILSGGTFSSTNAFTGQIHNLYLNGSAAAGLNASTATANFGSEGDWTIHGYARIANSTDFEAFCVRSKNGTVETFYPAVTSVSTVKFLVVTAASGFLTLTLHGRDTAGSNSTVDFSGISMAPYAYPYDQVSYQGSPTGLQPMGPTRPPFVMISGTVLQHTSKTAALGVPGPLPFRATVESVEMQPVSIDGTYYPDARQLSVKMVQK